MARRPASGPTQERVQKLSQGNEVWELTACSARIWVTPTRSAAYRPFLILIADTRAQTVVRHQMHGERPSSAQVRVELLQAMCRPARGAGAPRRPALIAIDDEALLAELAPTLEMLGIRAVYRHTLPVIAALLRAMEADLSRREPIPGLLSIPRVTVPLVGHLYEQAAELYRLTPWVWLNEQHPMELRVPSQSAPRYGVIIGSMGTVFGVVFYDSLRDLQLVLSGVSDFESGRGYSACMLYFDEAMAMSFDDLDALARFGWPVVNAQAYPVFGRTTHDGRLLAPAADDVFWIEGALAVLLHFLHGEGRRSGPGGRITLKLPVTTISGEVEGVLQIPVG